MIGETDRTRAIEREALDEALARMDEKNGRVDEEAVDAITARLRQKFVDGDKPG